MVVVITGPAGAGKTTVGKALAQSLGWRFSDADDLHSPENIAQMTRGEGLSDAERWPWLARVKVVMAGAAAAGEHLVVACSALRESYRRFLAEGVPAVRFVFLTAGEKVLRERLARREDHFAGEALLDGQLATLERPADALQLDATLPVELLVGRIRGELGR